MLLISPLNVSRDNVFVNSGCLQLLEILEILEISWNLKFLLEILEISWIFVDAPGKTVNRVKLTHTKTFQNSYLYVH